MLTVDRLKKMYTSTLGLHHASFNLADGAALALVGPNGAGKTTLIKVLADIYRPDSGQCLLDGTPLRLRKEDIGYMPETPFVMKELSGLSFLSYIAGMKGLATHEEILRLIGFFGADSYVSNKLVTLSQGQMRCVSLIAALMGSPRLLLLDEPTNSLDTMTILRLKDIIESRKAAGQLTLISSHVLDFVKSCTSHALFIKAGRTLPMQPTDPDLERQYLAHFA